MPRGSAELCSRGQGVPSSTWLICWSVKHGKSPLKSWSSHFGGIWVLHCYPFYLMCSKQFLKPVILRCERLTAIVGAPLCAVDLYRHSALPVKSDYQRVYLTGMSNMTGVLLLTTTIRALQGRQILGFSPGNLGIFLSRSTSHTLILNPCFPFSSSKSRSMGSTLKAKAKSQLIWRLRPFVLWFGSTLPSSNSG